jgi:HEAT repeat protein/cytochrome c biogenesis protein CcdA
MLLETLGSEGESAAVRGLVRELKPFPAARLVGLLAHARLSVRLGALELLEDAAGDTFGFDAWQEDPAAGANVEPLAKWKTWAEKGTVAAPTAGGKLSDETFRVIALEITSGSRERAERAMTRLDAYGLPAIAHIEAFFRAQPNLAPAPRAALKAAEYRLALRQSMPRQAAALARDLALGTNEAQSTALSALAGAGPGALPVIGDFLSSPDPLVRETAVDAAFAAGAKNAVSLILPRVDEEKAESVLHAMIRGLGQHGSTQAHSAAIAKFLTHASENVIISAIEALGASNAFVASADLAPRLDDPHWRVRAAALEAIGRRSFSDLKDKVIARLDDPDLFVRVTAVATVMRVATADAQELLLARFEKQDDLKAPILRALFTLRQPPPAKIWELLAKAPPEIILQCLDTFESRDDHEGRHAPYAAPFVKHPNPDVAAAALRLLASHGRHTALLLEALQSNDPVKQDAVLDQLHLPRGFLAGTQSAAAAPPTREAGNPKIDRLYEALQAATPKRAGAPADPGAADEAHAAPAQMRAVLTRFLRQGSPRQRLRAAIVLAGEHDEEATRHILSVFDTLSGLDRRLATGVLSNLGNWPDGPARELALRLLRDPADDVREQAIRAWVDEATVQRVTDLLAELSRPGSLLKPDDIYDYDLDSAIEGGQANAPITTWSNGVLADAAAPDAHKVLAMVLLSRIDKAGSPAIVKLIEAKNPWLRRAAYRALGLANAQSHLDALLRDESAHVRTVLPFLASPQNDGWRHWFDDAHSAQDYGASSRTNRISSRPAFGEWAGQPKQGGGSVTPEIISALERLARDPSDLVRFEAQFSLLRLGHPIDPATFAGLAAVQSSESEARSRLGDYLEENFTRLGKAYGVLLPLTQHVSPQNMTRMLQHFGLADDKTFTSFAAIAQLAPAAPNATDAAIAPPSEPPAVKTDTSFRVVFFFKHGCRECERTRDMLNRLAADFPKMTLDERDINDPDVARQNEVLSTRFQVRGNLHQVTPSVFTQEEVLIGGEITFASLSDLLRHTAAAPIKDHWADVDAAQIAAASKTIENRFDALSLGVVTTAGLLDGINPCAFATIIFLLSYLQVARRTPREILAVGFAFISAVFLTYFLVGLGLLEIIARLSALRWAGLVLNYTLAGFALIVAVLSFRDAQLASRGQMGEMTLQLPGSLKERIRTAIRTGSKATRFVVAAFVTGVVISLLELACTGQVYLPTIQYMLRAGRTTAVAYLLLYNCAFVFPLIVVFFLAWFGLRSDALIRFQKNNTPLVKVLTGVLFLLLTAFLLFGHDWFTHAPVGGK